MLEDYYSIGGGVHMGETDSVAFGKKNCCQRNACEEKVVIYFLEKIGYNKKREISKTH